ncbi:MAG: MarC family protein [Alphaproteobacteria bacterium]|nr:MarC family protein [Alphaproteobacteria bacterium]
MFSLFNMQQFISSFIVLFAVIDITGSIPIILRLKKNGKKVNAMKAAILAFLMFMIFFYVGEAFLKLFHLDISSFAIAGSLIIFIMAMEMILDIEIFKDQPNSPKDATFIPIVFPLVAGAGALTTLLSIRSQYEDINIILAIIANVIIVYFAIRLAKNIEQKLGLGVIYMMQKFFGIILLAISVKLFITNITLLIAQIKG